MGVFKNMSNNIRSAMRDRNRQRLLNNLPFEISMESLSESDKFTRRQDAERLKQYNDDVIAWTVYVTSRLKSNVRMLVKRDHVLSDSIQPNVYYDRKYASEVNRIGFSFAREGIYLHKGAGHGQGGFKGGSSWYNRHGQKKMTMKSSLMKMATGNREPVEWFDPIIEQELPKLADIIASYSITLQLNASTIYID